MSSFEEWYTKKGVSFLHVGQIYEHKSHAAYNTPPEKTAPSCVLSSVCALQNQSLEIESLEIIADSH